MYTSSCAAMGVPTCAFTATGETPEEVMAKMTEHGMAEHPAELKVMEETMSPEQLADMMKAAITEV